MFVINALMDDMDCIRLRRQLAERGLLVCDLPDAEEDDPAQRRWLVGTFAVGPIVMTLRHAHVPILYVEKVHPAAVTDLDNNTPLTRIEQLSRYGAERVCSTESFKGALMLAMAANEVTAFAPKLEDQPMPEPLVEQLIQELAAQDSQWVTSEV